MQWILLLALLLSWPAGLEAQHEICALRTCESRPTASDPPAWLPDALVLTVNAVAGGLTAGIARRARGESFWQGFVRGAAGGTVTFAGKRIAAERFMGAGVLGREVAAVGGSMVANASEGRGMFERMVLPVGLVRVHWDRTAEAPLRLKVDLPGTIATGYVLLQPEYTLDWHSTLSAGTPVFLAHNRPEWAGLHAAGVVLLRTPHPQHGNPVQQLRAHLAHEQIHVLQYDFSALAWSKPAERWLLEKVPAGAAIHRHVDLGMHLIPWALLNGAVPYPYRPWEMEAMLLVP